MTLTAVELEVKSCDQTTIVFQKKSVEPLSDSQQNGVTEDVKTEEIDEIALKRMEMMKKFAGGPKKKENKK